MFIDGFSAGLNYAAFGGSKVTAFDVDTDVKYEGSASMEDLKFPILRNSSFAYAGASLLFHHRTIYCQATEALPYLSLTEALQNLDPLTLD
ncbi:MAG: hypothetical protein U5L72_19490 [Bacteroidales bacterium]|nr:hypothetical protein [Bacteroidales bacterium]